LFQGIEDEGKACPTGSMLKNQALTSAVALLRSRNSRYSSGQKHTPWQSVRNVLLVRLFIFDNRIAIISPGHLPNNLTVERIRADISNIRNPILVSFIAKGLLPYHDLGSGIKRALDEWPHIDFVDDREGCIFTAIVHRKEIARSVDTGVSRITPGKTLGKTPGKIAALLRENPGLSIPELAEQLGKSESAIERAVRKLRKTGQLKRIGPAKGGHWEVVEKSEG
jgi:ATP-dependent DNA helicase RecG